MNFSEHGAHGRNGLNWREGLNRNHPNLEGIPGGFDYARIQESRNREEMKRRKKINDKIPKEEIGEIMKNYSNLRDFHEKNEKLYEELKHAFEIKNVYEKGEVFAHAIPFLRKLALRSLIQRRLMGVEELDSHRPDGIELVQALTTPESSLREIITGGEEKPSMNFHELLERVCLYQNQITDTVNAVGEKVHILIPVAKKLEQQCIELSKKVLSTLKTNGLEEYA